jgi:hypothetical protein
MSNYAEFEELRWLRTGNGYCSESVDFRKC